MIDIDYRGLIQTGQQLNSQFSNNAPFPHVVIDNFLDNDSYDLVRQVFPGPDDDIWKVPSNIHTQQKMVTKRGDLDIKELLFTQEAKNVLREFNSPGFLTFLEELSGIQGLMADPYLAEAGFHCTGDQGYLDIHADFSHHDKLGIERRVNLIYFLNDGWQEEFGGHLKLYNEELVPEQSVLPIGNRCVIFKTSEKSFHGHPEPMNLPGGAYRKSLAFYYYTIPTSRPKSKIVFPEDPEFIQIRSDE